MRMGSTPLPDRQRANATLSVLDVTEWYGETSGGIRTYLDEKGRYVAQRPELRHVVVVPGEHDAIEDGDGARRYRLRGPRIPRYRPYRFMLATRSLNRIVRHERPDLIEVGSPFLVPWIISPVARSMHVPMVSFHHTNVSGLTGRQWYPSAGIRQVAQHASLRYLRQLNSLSHVSIVASESAKKELQAAGVERIAEVPLGVDIEHFSPQLRSRALHTRARWGLPGPPLVGFAGRFAREKQLDVLLDAWPAVERATDARLVLVGAGPEEARLRAHPYASRVFFLPFQQDRDRLAEIMAMLDLLVAPSPVETFGLSALEALSCGTPVLSADRGGVAEQVIASGGGALFRSGEAGSLTEAAIALLKSDLAALGNRGRSYAVREHAWPTVLDRLFAVYRHVVAS
jgi:alpha-1,6-mannosyltransferase